jgi:hypothetical protein
MVLWTDTLLDTVAAALSHHGKRQMIRHPDGQLVFYKKTRSSKYGRSEIAANKVQSTKFIHKKHLSSLTSTNPLTRHQRSEGESASKVLTNTQGLRVDEPHLNL